MCYIHDLRSFGPWGMFQREASQLGASLQPADIEKVCVPAKAPGPQIYTETN